MIGRLVNTLASSLWMGVTRRDSSGTTPHVSTLCLSDITARDHISQAFPLHISILQAIQVWRWERPRNEATNYCFMQGTYRVQRSDKAMMTSESWNKLHTQQWKYQTLHTWNDPSLYTWLKLAWTSPRLVRSISSFVCMHVGLYAMAGSAGHLHHTLLLPLHAPVLLTHPISFIEQVCQQWDHAWVTPTKGEGKDSCCESGWKELLHCAAYVLLPHSCLPHNVL